MMEYCGPPIMEFLMHFSHDVFTKLYSSTYSFILQMLIRHVTTHQVLVQILR